MNMSKEDLRVTAIDMFAGLKRVLWRTAVVSRSASISLIEALPENDNTRYSSVVVEYIVPGQKSWAFRWWHMQLIRSARNSKGFVRVDRHRPLNCKDGVLKWYWVVHFDQPEHLNQWLASKEREAILHKGRDIFESYRFKSFTTGLEGWFSKRAGTELDSLGPAAWKQILSVVLALYPVIMVQDRIFGYFGIMEDWSMASAMWVNLMITSCILTFIVMPFVVRLLDFWLQPAHQETSVRAEVLGTTSTLLAMGAMVLLFNVIA
jgi:antibiotic biosynthesis monooxygenase (ABM) superfamily enzyme